MFVGKLCSPCFWIHDALLIFISDLNYAVVALEGYWFLEGGRWIRDRINQEQVISYEFLRIIQLIGKTKAILQKFGYGNLIMCSA